MSTRVTDTLSIVASGGNTCHKKMFSLTFIIKPQVRVARVDYYREITATGINGERFSSKWPDMKTVMIELFPAPGSPSTTMRTAFWGAGCRSLRFIRFEKMVKSTKIK